MAESAFPGQNALSLLTVVVTNTDDANCEGVRELEKKPKDERFSSWGQMIEGARQNSATVHIHAQLADRAIPLSRSEQSQHEGENYGRCLPPRPP